MQRVVTVENMKLLEKLSDEQGVSFDQLMINAGSKLADVIIQQVSESGLSKDVLFLCGNGNNAGDGFVASKILSKNGFKVSIALLCGTPKSELAVKHFSEITDSVYITDNFEIIKNLAVSSSLIVDSVFGSGFHGDLDFKIQEIFNIANKSKLKIAVDVPSGGNCVSGNISDGIFSADITVTFAFPKFGMCQYPLFKKCGKIVVVDIGISDNIVEKNLFPSIYLLDDEIVTSNLSQRNENSHKGDFGKLLNLCGSNRMSGACMLAGKAALRSGLGLLISATSEASANRTVMYIPEGMVLPLESDENGFVLFDSNYKLLIEYSEKSSAMLIGCGLGVTDDTKMLVKYLLKNADCPLTLDADGINCISDEIDVLEKIHKSPIVLTPHPAEMARLLNISVAEVQKNRFSAAFNFSKKYNCITVLKGAGTVIASPDKVYINLTGNPGMSCGGSGDVLAGIIASFVAQGMDGLNASALAAYIHGKAGDLAQLSISQTALLPSDIIDALPDIFFHFNL